MTNAYKIAQQYVGQCLDFDGYPPEQPYQCVDLVMIVAKQFGFELWGNGNEIGTKGDLSPWADVIPYTEGMELQVGDIFSTTEPGGGDGTIYGHTFVYGGGELSNALIVEQNYQHQCTVEHRRAIYGYGNTIHRIVRIKSQDNYEPTDANGVKVGNAKETDKFIARDFFEITCDKVEGIKSPGDTTVIETFYKCNKVTGKINGEWLIYDKYDGSVAYIPISCVKKLDDYSTTKKEEKKKYETPNGYDWFTDKTTDGIDQSGTQKIYSLAQFVSLGRIKEANYEWTYSAGSSFPDNVVVPGKGFNAYGFLSDGDGNIIMSAPKTYGDIIGRTYNTPFGFKGKVYTTNDKTSFDVYVR